jgi:hypothetical protein
VTPPLHHPCLPTEDVCGERLARTYGPPGYHECVRGRRHRTKWRSEHECRCSAMWQAGDPLPAPTILELLGRTS